MDRRRFLSLAGAGGLAGGTGWLAGCSGAGQGGDSADLGAVTVMLPQYATEPPDPNGELQKAIEAFLGKKLTITWVPTGYDDKVNVVLASGDVPELLATGKTPNFVRSAQAGAFWDLTHRIGDLPDLKPEFPDTMRNASINGKLFGLPKTRDPIRSATIVRKDWLDKLGLEMPKTTQDLYEIATAFHTERPNGKDKCVGLIIPKWTAYGSASPYDLIEVWYGAPNKWGLRGDALVPGFDTEEFFEAIDFVKKMITEGLINSDFVTMDPAKWNQPFFTGAGGIIIDVSSRGGDLLKLFKEKDPENYGSYVDMTGNLAGPDGQLHAYPTVGYNGFIAVSRQSVPTEAEFEDLLQVLAKLNSKDGQVLINNGIEGQDFTLEDGYAVANKDSVLADPNVQSFNQLGMGVSGYKAYLGKPAGPPEAELAAKQKAFHKADLEHAVPDPSLPYVSETYTAKGAQLDQIVSDGLLKYLAGNIDLAGFRNELKRWHTSGGDDIARELTELHQQG